VINNKAGSKQRIFTRKRFKPQGSLVPNYVILTLLIIFAMGPMFVLLFNSFKPSTEIGANPIGLPREGIDFANYETVWRVANYSVTMRNSLIIVAGTVVGVLVISGMAAYALARLKVPGHDAVMFYLLLIITMPAQLFLIPLFYLWKQLGLVDSLFGVIIIYWAVYSPFVTFLLRSYMIEIPVDMEDAARVDGASEWQVFTRVTLPLSWPGFLTAGLVVALWSYNEFLFAVTFLHSPEMKTVATSLSMFAGFSFAREWGLTSAASMIMILPVIIIFLLLQRQFITGLTNGGMKA
jgi:raffinose/stachyose/melibiose transport system permease protein